MKIAAASDDGFNISEHFGRAPYYVVLTVENGVIVDKEKRPKTGHHTFAAHEHPKLAAGERHGFDAGAQSRGNGLGCLRGHEKISHRTHRYRRQECISGCI